MFYWFNNLFNLKIGFTFWHKKRKVDEDEDDPTSFDLKVKWKEEDKV